MNRRTTRHALAVALAPLTVLLCGCSADAPTATATTTARASSSTSSPSSSSTLVSPNSFTPIPTQGAGPIPAGKVGMTANGRPDAPWAVLSVPNGWDTIGGWSISNDNPGGEGVVGYWTIDNVYQDPCEQSETPGPTRIPAGSTVESLAAAFKQQRLSRLTPPVPVTLGGYRGLSLELHAPKALDVTTCPHYRVWEWTTAGERYMQDAGAFDRLHILDVEGKVVVFSIPASADTPKAEVDRISQLLESVEFVPRS